jgi:hypothetical protein
VLCRLGRRDHARSVARAERLRPRPPSGLARAASRRRWRGGRLADGASDAARYVCRTCPAPTARQDQGLCGRSTKFFPAAAAVRRQPGLTHYPRLQAGAPPARCPGRAKPRRPLHACGSCIRARVVSLSPNRPLRCRPPLVRFAHPHARFAHRPARPKIAAFPCRERPRPTPPTRPTPTKWPFRRSDDTRVQSDMVRPPRAARRHRRPSTSRPTPRSSDRAASRRCWRGAPRSGATEPVLPVAANA